MSISKKILLVEDDETLGYLLQEYLRMSGFEVAWCKNGKAGLGHFESETFDIALIDVMMPVMDGLSLLNAIKTLNALFPIILLTSKGLKIDKLKGFKAGADDYIVKPVDEEELLARINAVLRRSGVITVQDRNVFEIGLYHFDFKMQYLSIHNEAIPLSLREAELLKALCMNIDKLTETKTVLKEVWGKQDFFNRKSMDVFIYKLRQHLKADERIKILNIHGKGYILKVTN
jgi:DNA-binding response OmpR family regulator